MKRTKKLLSILLMVCMILGMMPLTAWAGDPPIPNSVGTNGQYATMAAALTAAVDGTTITLLNDITESVSYTVSSAKTITIDGNSHTITGTQVSTNVNDEGEMIVIQSSVALFLSGSGSINLKDITLLACTVTGSNSNSTGLGVLDTVNVQSSGVVNAYGGIANQSYGLFNFSKGIVNLTNAKGADCGVYNELAGTVNVDTATGTGVGSEGVYNSLSGTVNVTTATGVRCGAYNDSSSTGTINVNSAVGTGTDSSGANNQFKGTINVDYAYGVSNSVINSGIMNITTANGNISNSGTMNVGTLAGAINNSGTINKGSDTYELPLIIDSSSSCVLSSIVVASGIGIATTIGILPSVYTNGIKGSWYTNSGKTTLFSSSTVTDVSALYGGFPDTAISIATISGVTAPVGGATPVSEITATSEYTGTITWSPASATFIEGEVYTANITLLPKTGYTLTGVSANFFTVSGASAANAASDGVITAVFPATSVASITKGITTTYYLTLADAMSAAGDGETVKLLRNINESITYNVVTGKTITIDGAGFTLTGEETKDSTVLTLSGAGTIHLKDITLQVPSSNNDLIDTSCGLLMTAGCSAIVQSIGTVNAYGRSSWVVSYGVRNLGTGTINISTAVGGNHGDSIGASNESTGTINVVSAKGVETGTSIGVKNSGSGVVNVNDAISLGGAYSYGVLNSGSGTVNVFAAKSGVASLESYGVKIDAGTVNVGIATCDGSSTKYADIHGSGANTGTSVTALTLYKGTGASCVLDTIMIAKTDSTAVGILPNVTRNDVPGVWYTDSAKTQAFSGSTITGITVLYSTFSNTVTFDKNGGDTQASPIEKTVLSDGTLGSLPTIPTKSGYTFNGWNTSANGSGTVFTAATEVNANITVYAQWTLISNNNGGSTGGTIPAVTTPVTTLPVETQPVEIFPVETPIPVIAVTPPAVIGDSEIVNETLPETTPEISDEVQALSEEVVPEGGTVKLPKTGGLPMQIFYLLGSGIVGMGMICRRKKNKEQK